MGIALGGEGIELQLEALGQSDEQRGGERAAVVLDEVEVAGGDLQIPGELDLAQALLTAQCADLAAERGSLSHLTSIY